jgi:hypothetical protein
MRELRKVIVDELGRIAQTYQSDYEIAKAREDFLAKSLAQVTAFLDIRLASSKISTIVPPSHQLATDNRAPPEASICCPVTHRKSSESTAAIAAPTSSAWPRRPIAVVSTIC